jgi:hypothetical protein
VVLEGSTGRWWQGRRGELGNNFGEHREEWWQAQANELQQLCCVEVVLRKKREGKEREKKREARPCWPKENGPRGEMSWAAGRKVKEKRERKKKKKRG